MSIRLKDAIYDLVNLSNTSTTTGNSSIKLYVQNNDEVNFGGTPTNGSTTIYFGYRSVDSRTVPTSYIFGGSTGTATVTANGFKKKDSSDSYVLLGAGGHKAVSDFAVSSHTHTRSQITDFPTSMPASDVYAWAKAATKPSYNFGEIGAGIATIGDGTNQIYLRTNGNWASTIYHQSNADEAVVFLNAGKNVSSTNNYTTSWIFAYGTPANRPDWTTLTPAMQIKGNSVVINKLIGSKIGAEYNLDVNGSFNATSGYINKNAILHAGNTKITSGTITINGTNITPLTSLPSHDHTIYTLTSTRHDSDAPAPNSKNGLTFQFSYNIDSNWSNVLMMKSYSDDNYTCSQIITPAGNPGKDTGYSGDMKWRQGRNSTWLGWKTILDSNNYTTYTVTKTGTGASGTWGISISGNAATATSATSATTAGSANVATIARVLGSDDSMKLYANHSNEVNFGGTFKGNTTIFFGYRATDSKAIPTSFVFGSSTGTATITAKGFIMKDSSNSYVLLGGGGHKAVSDFATSGHTHSQYLTELPSHSHAYLPTEQVSVEQNSDAYTWIRSYALTDGKLRSHVYNTSGNEWSYWIGMSTSKAYGSIIRCSYNSGTPTIQVMGLFNGGWSNWRTCSFEGHTHDYAASSHTHSYLPLSGGTMSGCITTPGNDTVVIKPAKNNYDQIGASDCYFWKIFVTNTYTTNLYIGGEQITFTT